MSAPSPFFPFPVERRALPNGLRVLFVPVPADGLASYWTIVRTGSRDEVEAGVTGFAHFFEHMMFRGSERYPGPLYDRIVKSIGADANAYTTDDYTAYHLSVATEDLPTVIDIEADRFQHLAYGEAAFRTEAGAVYGEYRKGRTDPFEVLIESLHDRAFEAHTYKHTTMGFVADIERMPEQYAYSLSFFRRFYRPDNVVIVVTGDFDVEATWHEIEARYGGWAQGYRAPAVPVEPEQVAQRRVDVAFDGQTLPILAVMWKGERFDATSRSMVAGKLIGELAFGETSRLYKKLVLEEQRVEQLGASFDSTRDPGLWGVLAMVKDIDDMVAVEAEIFGAVEELAEGGVVATALEATRSHLKYRFLSGLASPSEVAEAVARVVALTGDVVAIDALYATLDALTVADVREVAGRLLTRARSTVARLAARGAELPSAPDDGGGEAAPVDATGLGQAPVLMPVAADPNVSIQIWIKAGSQDDPPGLEGLAQLTASLVAEGGTERLGYDRILEALYPMAASYEAQVDKEMTIFKGTAHRDHADGLARHMLEALTRPRFDEADFERLRDNAISYLENVLRYASDEELGKAALYGSIFWGTRYAHVADGTVGALRGLTLEHVERFYRARYTRETVVLAVGGGYEPALVERLEAGLARLPSGPETTTPEVTPAPLERRRVVIVEKPGESTAISFGWPITLRRGTREFYAAWVACSWLGEHRNSASHLFQVIREARGMNYGDYAYIEAFPEGGERTMPPQGVGRRRQIFEVWIRPVPEGQAVFALRAALREVERLAAHGLTATQLEETRSFLSKYVRHFAETTEERLGYAIDDRFYGITDEGGHLATFRKILSDLTLDEVNAAAAAHFRADAAVIAMVTAHGEAMRDALASGEATPIGYGPGIEKSAEHLAEDALIAAHPLGIAREQVVIVPVDAFAA